MAVAIQNGLLEGLRAHLLDMVSKGRYKLGGTWYDAEIVNKEVGENHLCYITLVILPMQGDGSVATDFQLLSSDGTLLATDQKNVPFASGLDAVQFRFILNVRAGGEE